MGLYGPHIWASQTLGSQWVKQKRQIGRDINLPLCSLPVSCCCYCIQLLQLEAGKLFQITYTLPAGCFVDLSDVHHLSWIYKWPTMRGGLINSFYLNFINLLYWPQWCAPSQLDKWPTHGGLINSWPLLRMWWLSLTVTPPYWKWPQIDTIAPPRMLHHYTSYHHPSRKHKEIPPTSFNVPPHPISRCDPLMGSI